MTALSGDWVRPRHARIVIAESILAESLKIFERLSPNLSYDAALARDRTALLGAARDVEVLIVRNTVAVDRELLENAPRLVAVGRLGSGLETIDLACARERGVAIIDAGDANARAVAEYVFGAMLSYERSLPALDAAVRAGSWPRFAFPSHELGGKTLGVVGLGRCGRRVAALGLAFEMTVLGLRRTPGLPAALVGTGVERVDKGELLARSDYVVLMLPPLTGEVPFLDAAAISSMRTNAVLVNAARGSLVDEPVLSAALEAGSLRAALLDARFAEPPPSGDALVAHRNVVSTPHVAGLTSESQIRVAERVAEGIRSALARAEAARELTD